MRSSSWAIRPSLLALLVLIGLLVGLIALVPRESRKVTAAAPAASATSPTPAIVPLFTWTEPAKNPVRLHVLTDRRRVVGWLSGADFSGQKVRVQAGDVDTTLTVNESNTFSWEYVVEEAKSATFRVGDLHRTVLLQPAGAAASAAFFTLDRFAYRPGQTLQFAAFLRHLDARDEWQPIKNRAVEVHLVSDKKGTVAARLKLTSDDFGRVTGSYTFIEDDPLDQYTLGIPGFHGTAKLTVADYRKAKVRLTIAGKVEGGRLKLTFAPRDFREQPMPGSKVHFTARVVREKSDRGTHALSAPAFALAQPAHQASRNPLDPSQATPTEASFDFEAMDEEQRLLFDAGATPVFTGLTEEASVGRLQGELDMKNRTSADYSAALHEDWLRGPHAVIVEGVVVDPYGQEQRATQRITLKAEDRRLDVSIAKRYFTTGETIRLTAQARGKDGKAVAGTSIVTAHRLLPNTNAWWGGGFGAEAIDIEESADLAEAAGADRKVDGAFAVSAQPATTVRKLVSASAYKGDSATLKLARPGAYQLLTITELEDGTILRQETGCVVLPRDRFPGVVLKLDRKDYRAGDELTGVIHSRFAGAKVLLTVRDGAGIRLTRSMVLKEKVTEVRIPVAAEWSYGLQVDVLYHDNQEQIAAAGEFVRVLPAARIIDIKTHTKKVYGPGESVRLEIQVNRKEPVDLVVSVYDRSLRTVAADRSVNVRDFFLADERARRQDGWEMLRMKLGEMTVGDLVKRAKEKLRQLEKADPRREDAASSWGELKLLHDEAQLTRDTMVTLLALAEVPIGGLPGIDGPGIVVDDGRPNGPHWARLAALLEMKVIDALQRQFPAPTYHPFTNRIEFGSPNLWQRGFNQFGFGGIGGIGGFGGMGFNGFRGGMMMGIPPSDPNEGYGNPGGMNIGGFNMGGSVMPGAQASRSFPTGGHAGAQLIHADADQSGLFVRRDFSDTAYWNSRARTDAEGKAVLEFKLPDSLTNWQVVVNAVSAKMHVGQQVHNFESSKPIMVAPMLPRVFTAGDRVEFFGSVLNLTAEKQTIRARLKVDNGEILSPVDQAVEVPANGNKSVYWTFTAREAGFTQILMSVDCAAGSDASLKRLPVIEAAAEQVITRSGFCKGEINLDLPPEVDPSRASLDVTLTPSLAADMVDTLDYLVEYPYGCVEQTMSRFLPAIKVAQTLKRSGIKHARLEQRLPGCVEGGIKRLLELQSDDGGWGWQGGEAHAMMTPYALLGLLEAEKAGYTIPNPNAIDRGLQRLRQFIGAVDRANHPTDQIFCIYVAAKRQPIEPIWWNVLLQKAREDALSDYALAMALELAVEHKQNELADLLALRLRDRAHQADGKVHWRTAAFTHWADDRFEITAAALKALTAYDVNDRLIPGTLAYFAATKRGNRWNSTKDTAMILFALSDYLAKRQIDPRARAEASFRLNDGEARKAAFEGGLMHKITVPGADLKAKNRLTLAGSDGTMYRAVLRYKRVGRNLAATAHGLKVERTLTLLDDKGQRVRELKSGESIPRGSYVESAVTVERAASLPMSYVLVVNPKPTGGEAVPETDARFPQPSEAFALREDRATGIIMHHEDTPHTFTDRAVFLAELAGEFVLSPANAELMYETEVRGHSGTFVLKVAEK